MGGPAGSGGSDKSDERKVDTYSDQLMKEQKMTRDKFGYKVKRKRKVGDFSPILGGVENFFDKRELNKRMEFANKYKIPVSNLSTEKILSKDFKSQLDAKGYTKKGPRNVTNTRDSDNQNKPDLKIGKFPNEGGDVVPTLPYEPSSGDDENLTAEEIALRNKRKGRKRTVLTSVSGDTSKATLGKKTLLGA